MSISKGNGTSRREEWNKAKNGTNQLKLHKKASILDNESCDPNVRTYTYSAPANGYNIKLSDKEDLLYYIAKHQRPAGELQIFAINSDPEFDNFNLIAQRWKRHGTTAQLKNLNLWGIVILRIDVLNFVESWQCREYVGVDYNYNRFMTGVAVWTN